MKVLQFSILLILSQFVLPSYQQCLDTTRIRGYTFALAHVKDPSNPLAPQEACYYSCGAQIVTHSSNRGDMTHLTLMDKAASRLTNSGFLKSGQFYLVNHLGMKDTEGGNGIGCIEVLPTNQVRHYPISNNICSRAKVAVCGFWGAQDIPTRTSDEESPTPEPTETPETTEIPESAESLEPEPTTSWSRRHRHHHSRSHLSTSEDISTSSEYDEFSSTDDITSTTNDKETSIETSSTSTFEDNNTDTSITGSIESNIDVDTFIDESTSVPDTHSETDILNILGTVTVTEIEPVGIIHLVPEVVPTDPDIITQFDANGVTYKVIKSSDHTAKDAGLTCERKQSKLSTLSSSLYDQVAGMLRTSAASRSKIIIGSWNRDTYLFNGDDCLILQVNYGIYPGSCSEAPAVLCQSSENSSNP